MKFLSFVTGGRKSWGLVEGGDVRDVGELLATDYPTLSSWLSGGDEKRLARAASSAKRIDLACLSFQPTIPTPGKIFCVGHNYETHREETGRARCEYPSIFTRFADTQVGHGEAIIVPRASASLDYEGELAIVVGRAGRSISRGDAWSHVGGFCCFNDASVRDWQWHTSQFTPGKNFPGTGACGPWLVTPDEVPDFEARSIETRLNGEVLQRATFADMIFPIPTIIEYISTFSPLSPGDIICTGTPGGVGAKRRPPVWMKDGDTVEVAIDGIGVLRNPVRAEP